MSFAFSRALVAIALLVLGFALQAVSRTPPVELSPIVFFKLTPQGTIDPDFVKQQLAFAQRKQDYVKTLEAPYADYPSAFLAARAEEDFPKIRAAIDRELAESETIERDGLGAVPGLVGDRLGHVSLLLAALAAAVAFQTFAFVAGAAFLVGTMHTFAASMNTLTGLTSEHYLAAILAALIVASAAWLVLRRAWPAPPP